MGRFRRRRGPAHLPGSGHQGCRGREQRDGPWPGDRLRGRRSRGRCGRHHPGAASNISPTINEKGDELRDKIEAARQRIADQVAKNADADADAAEIVKDVAETAKEAAKDAAATAEEGAKETAAEVKEAAGEVAKAAEGKKDEK